MDEEPKKKHRGPAPIIIPKKISDWISANKQETKINNFKRGGGHSYNGKK